MHVGLLDGAINHLSGWVVCLFGLLSAASRPRYQFHLLIASCKWAHMESFKFRKPVEASQNEEMLPNLFNHPLCLICCHFSTHHADRYTWRSPCCIHRDHVKNYGNSTRQLSLQRLLIITNGGQNRALLLSGGFIPFHSHSHSPSVQFINNDPSEWFHYMINDRPCWSRVFWVSTVRHSPSPRRIISRLGFIFWCCSHDECYNGPNSQSI